MRRGYFGVAVYHPKKEVNIGTLWRHAMILGADFVCTIGRRYVNQSSDTVKAHRHIPLFHYDSFEDFYRHMPKECYLIGVELTPKAQELKDFSHPQRAIYLLGAEDYGLPESVLKKCHRTVKLKGEFSMNVAVVGSMVMYHREAL